MNQLHLGHRLGAVGSSAPQRYQNERQIYSLEHDDDVNFAFARPSNQADGSADSQEIRSKAHPAGVNCLAFDHNDARYLVSGGADASVRFWDLEPGSETTTAPSYHPAASLSRNDKSAHTHAISSISIYPFDPTPSTLLSTAFDNSIKLSAITPTSITPVHTFKLDYAPYVHAISPVPSETALIAAGTAHPAIRLLDLRSGLSTHSLQGHGGAVYALAWSPVASHLLVSGSHDGRVLFFDVRRANAAFASLDLDDAVGLDVSEASAWQSDTGKLPQTLNFSSLAHNGPVTSVQFHPSTGGTPTILVTAGQDQRIRLWDLATGRNELVHFGPRIKNARIGSLSPLLSPAGHVSKSSRELLFWPNDDARGEIMVHSLREGNLIRVLNMRGFARAEATKDKSKVARLTSKGRINQIVWRQGESIPGGALEMYGAHGDGSISVWKPEIADENEDEEQEIAGSPHIAATGPTIGFNAVVEDDHDPEERAKEAKRKRKAEMLEGLVAGLTRKTPRQ